ADTAAAALAVALGAAKLVVLTDVAGLYAGWPGEGDGTGQPGDVVSTLTATGLGRPLPGPATGMIPQVGGRLHPGGGGPPRGHGPTCWTAGCRIRCCWRSSPTPASAPWSSRTVMIMAIRLPEQPYRHDHQRTRGGASEPYRRTSGAVSGGADAHIRGAAGSAGP